MRKKLSEAWPYLGLLVLAILFIYAIGCDCESTASSAVTAEGYKILKTKTVWKVYVKDGYEEWEIYIFSP